MSTKKLALWMFIWEMLVFNSGTRSRIHEHTISLRFLGIILRVLRLEVSVYNVYSTNQFQITFAKGEGKVQSAVHVNSKEETPFLSQLRPRIRLLDSGSFFFGTARKKALHNKCQSARIRPRLEFFSVSGLCYISFYIWMKMRFII
jgi:hypothetical protein